MILFFWVTGTPSARLSLLLALAWLGAGSDGVTSGGHVYRPGSAARHLGGATRELVLSAAQSCFGQRLSISILWPRAHPDPSA